MGVKRVAGSLRMTKCVRLRRPADLQMFGDTIWGKPWYAHLPGHPGRNCRAA